MSSQSDNVDLGSGDGLSLHSGTNRQICECRSAAAAALHDKLSRCSSADVGSLSLIRYRLQVCRRRRWTACDSSFGTGRVGCVVTCIYGEQKRLSDAATSHIID